MSKYNNRTDQQWMFVFNCSIRVMFLKFWFFLIILSIGIVFLIRTILKLLNEGLFKKEYKLTNKFIFYFTYIAIFLLAIFIGKKILYSIL